jgi:Helix-turn-helix domain
VNATSSRCLTPSETKRTGRGGCAPFASLPTWIADDPTIPALDKAILLVLAGHAWGGTDVCWPANATIAAKVGCSPGHVKRRLKALESRGLIDREPSPLNRTGRMFKLLWRDPPGVPAPPLRGSRARPESEASEGKKKERPESDSGQEGPPPPAVEKEEDPPASAEDLARFQEWSTGADPVLARLGRAALKLAGVVEPVVADQAVPPPAVGLPTPPVPIAEVEVGPPALAVPSSPPRPAAVSTSGAGRSRPPYSRSAGGTPTRSRRPFLACRPRPAEGPRQLLEQMVDIATPASPLLWMIRRSP